VRKTASSGFGKLKGHVGSARNQPRGGPFLRGEPFCVFGRGLDSLQPFLKDNTKKQTLTPYIILTLSQEGAPPFRFCFERVANSSLLLPRRAF